MPFDRLIIDSSHAKTRLCALGAEHGTDKSPYNEAAVHRHPYTAIYDLLFFPLRDRAIDFAEVGILDNASMRMWRSYFTRARLHAFEYSQELIDRARSEKLRDTSYAWIDVSQPDTIKAAFETSDVLFDVIIDDSTHLFEHQVNFVKSTVDFVKPGGLIVVEDVFRPWDEERYAAALAPILHLFEPPLVILAEHEKKFSEGMPEPYYDNDKLLVLRRNKEAGRYQPRREARPVDAVGAGHIGRRLIDAVRRGLSSKDESKT